MQPPKPRTSLSEHDARQLEARGVSLAEAERQLDRLRHPPHAPDLVRPCTPGDGIERLEAARLAGIAARHEQAASRGELCAFVPASGAASRMFRELIAYRRDARPLTPSEIEADRDAGNAAATVLLEFARRLDRFAFREALERVLVGRGERLPVGDASLRPTLAALLDADGLGYASSPKALVLFHRYAEGARTAFEEHLSEAAGLFRDAAGQARLHATVPAEHLTGFRAALEHARVRDEPRWTVAYDVELSIQDPATDTLALDASGQPFRDADGALVLRPSGHGALLANLAATRSPIAFIKNVDNVLAEPHRGPVDTWTRLVVGRLCELLERVRALVPRLEDPRDAAAVEEAAAFSRDVLGDASVGPALDPGIRRVWLLRRLDRPLRVCGMVPNAGEPGGGPFWVRERDGRITKQIVESSEVPAGDGAHRAVFERATHFNPVFMACALNDARGQRHDLAAFADAEAGIVTRRSSGGHELVTLERPGLWNGGMAAWNTVFVETPMAVFEPVKSVIDLLRPAHQTA